MVDAVSLPAGFKFNDAGVVDRFEGSVERLGGGRIDANVDPDYVFQTWRLRSPPVLPAVATEVRAFFRGCRGSVGYDFLFEDVLDNSFTDSVFGTGDGTRLAWQLAKTYTNGVRTYTHPVFFPGVGTLTVKVNAVTVDPGDYTVGATGLITFGAAPTNGHVITATVTSFKKPVRFASDLDVGLADPKGMYRIISCAVEEVYPT